MDYAMFLRGINVSGVRVPMPELRDCLADVGLDDVRTYLQTGNVTFSSAEQPRALRPMIEEALTSTFGYEAHVQVLPRAELAAVVAGYPFPAEPDHHRYAILCATDQVAADLVDLAQTAAHEPGGDRERVAAGTSVVYWSCPKGSTLSTPFSKVLGQRRFRATTTNRNLNTLEKML
ncbi:DUF1697 domain-containing protein [Raineyella sp. LH-20]|uniref:DUF1697 domain-containing protein n=1 Tax=Raineyella sp. LH-20 TaxID=3081204 RepID=UPI00295297A0|nr:DUF1697 domain-containing protein [Raineyella sp. LH-20]WOP18189.1 DUF1697 domain-containing protein [Raineyella sp. LH-20]